MSATANFEQSLSLLTLLLAKIEQILLTDAAEKAEIERLQAEVLSQAQQLLDVQAQKDILEGEKASLTETSAEFLAKVQEIAASAGVAIPFVPPAPTPDPAEETLIPAVEEVLEAE